MLEIKKDRIPYDYEVKDRLEFICKYANRDARFFNGNVISIERTNLHLKRKMVRFIITTIA